MSETTTTTTISDFLLARIAEDEEVAHGFDWATPDKYYLDGLGGSEEYVTCYISPARVLAECEAKRRLVELHAIQVERDRQSPFDPATGAERSEWAVDLYCDVCGWVSVACDTLRALASVDADHPDYQQEWRL